MPDRKDQLHLRNSSLTQYGDTNSMFVSADWLHTPRDIGHHNPQINSKKPLRCHPRNPYRTHPASRLRNPNRTQFTKGHSTCRNSDIAHGKLEEDILVTSGVHDHLWDQLGRNTDPACSHQLFRAELEFIRGKEVIRRGWISRQGRAKASLPDEPGLLLQEKETILRVFHFPYLLNTRWGQSQ